jgi:hypothetical protein
MIRTARPLQVKLLYSSQHRSAWLGGQPRNAILLTCSSNNGNDIIGTHDEGRRDYQGFQWATSNGTSRYLTTSSSNHGNGYGDSQYPKTTPYNPMDSPVRPAAFSRFQRSNPITFVPLSGDDRDPSPLNEAYLPNFVSSRHADVTPRPTSPKRFVQKWNLKPERRKKNPATIRRGQDQTTYQQQKLPQQHGQSQRHHDLIPPEQETTPPYRRHLTKQPVLESNSMANAMDQGASLFPDPTSSPKMPPKSRRVNPRRQRGHESTMMKPQYESPPRQRTVAQVLSRSQRKHGNPIIPIPYNEWVVVNNISPISTLEALVEGINDALDTVLTEHGGITDLEALWDPRTHNGQIQLPQLEFDSIFPQHAAVMQTIETAPIERDNNHDEDKSLPRRISPQDDSFRWVQEARMLLSPYGRPLGWKLKFANRSIVYALLARAKGSPVKCGWKTLQVDPWTTQVQQQLDDHFPPQEAYVEFAFAKPTRPSKDEENGNIIQPFGNNHLYYDNLDVQTLDWLDDSVVRVENVDTKVDEQDMLHVFGSYELKTPSIVRWLGKTNQGIKAPLTFFVRFADADWARAAIREKQRSAVGSKALLLVQFPKQRIPVKEAAARSFEAAYSLDQEEGKMVTERA